MCLSESGATYYERITRVHDDLVEADATLGSLRECLDDVFVLGKTHLRRVMKNYVEYYN
jgi:hypothetical protein